MSLVNATAYHALALPHVDPEGQRVVVVMVKATFELDRTGHVVLAAEPSPVRLADVLTRDDAPHGSVRYPSDLCCRKAGTDVVVVGSAISARPVTRMDVAVRVGAHEARLVVHGRRFFYRDLRKVAIGPSARFEQMPVIYEHAYGGMAPDHRYADERNPAGIGAALDPDDLVDTPAPQIEHPSAPHTHAGDDHPPMGFGATRSHWLPRRGYAGTFDEAWQKMRMPLLPGDYDSRFENVAHPSLQVGAGVPSGTLLAASGMSESGTFQCALPELPIVVHALRNGSRATVRPPVDLVLIEPARGRVELLARAVWTMGRGKTALREIRVDTDG